MRQTLRIEAGRWLDALGPRSQPELGSLASLLSPRECRALRYVIESIQFRTIESWHEKIISPLARLQLLIGLEHGTVTEQVRGLVIDEMAMRGWEWDDGEVKQAPLVRKTEVSAKQVNFFLRGGEIGVVKTTTLDRISRVVDLRVYCWGEEGVIYREIEGKIAACAAEEPKPRDERIPAGTVTEQVRQHLRMVVDRWGWSGAKMSKWTGVGQARISRFLRGEVIETDALDRIGAFLWVEIRAVDN